MAFGVTNKYSGLDMREGHAHLVELGLNDRHVDAVAENLAKTLAKLDVAENLIIQVLEIANSLRDDVLSR